MIKAMAQTHDLIPHVLGFTEVFSSAWQLYKKYIKEILFASLLAALLYVGTGKLFLQHEPSIVWFLVINLVLGALFNIPFALAVLFLDRREKKERVTFGSLISRTLPLWIPIILYTLLIDSMVYLGIALFIIPGLIAL